MLLSTISGTQLSIRGRVAWWKGYSAQPSRILHLDRGFGIVRRCTRVLAEQASGLSIATIASPSPCYKPASPRNPRLSLGLSVSASRSVPKHYARFPPRSDRGVSGRLSLEGDFVGSAGQTRREKKDARLSKSPPRDMRRSEGYSNSFAIMFEPILAQILRAVDLPSRIFHAFLCLELPNSRTQ